MIIEPGEKTPNTDNQLTMPGSEDSEEESSQEEQPVTPWSELTIVERVGLNSVEMSEEEVENAFCQIALAFRCDQYTLKQRLQGEEHARNLAEENIQLELSRGRETLETLKELCLDSKRRKILQRLELCLDILGGTVERILNTAEVLGAVHQEARVSRAVDLMVVHVENLKRRHNRDVAEMEEAKKLIQHNCRRNLNEPRIPRSSTTGSLVADAEESEAKMDNRIFQQYHSRRRVSTSVISKQTKRKGYLKKQNSVPTCLIMTKDDSNSSNDRPLVDPEETPSETSVFQPLPDPSSIPSTESPPKEVSIKKTPHKNSPLDALRHRHKGKATLSKKKTGKNKKGTRLSQPFSLGTCGLLLRQRPLAHWLHRCRWVLLCVYFLVLLCVVTLIYYLVFNFL